MARILLRGQLHQKVNIKEGLGRLSISSGSFIGVILLPDNDEEMAICVEFK
ncbi:unnamed protein product [Cunninghamella blakesleeana]